MNAILRNVTYNNPDIRREINNMLGKSYPLIQRFKLKGTGSPKLLISSASEVIMEKLLLDNNLNYINIEIRPGGIIVFFRSLLETFGWVLPFDKFNIILKGMSHEIRSGKDFMVFENNLKFNSADRFLNKIREQQDHFIINKNQKNVKYI